MVHDPDRAPHEAAEVSMGKAGSNSTLNRKPASHCGGRRHQALGTLCLLCVYLRYATVLEVSLVAQMVRNLRAMGATWVQSLCQEGPLEEGLATHSSILAWRIPWTEESGGLQSTGSQRVRCV